MLVQFSSRFLFNYQLMVQIHGIKIDNQLVFFIADFILYAY